MDAGGLRVMPLRNYSCFVFKGFSVYLTMLRKVGFYFLLFTFSLSIPGADQLIRLPRLLEHYLEHRSENASLGFDEFLYLHFVATGSHQHDSPEHAKLPFSGNHSCQAQHEFIKFQTRRQATDFSQTCASCTSELLIPRNTSQQLPAFHTDIWNPPKA